MSVLTVIPGPGFPTFGSLDETMANRSPFGSHEKSKTVSTSNGELIQLTTAPLLTFVFDDFDREILVPHPENLKVTEYGFLRLRVTVDLHAEEVSLVLPVQFTLKTGMSRLQGMRRSSPLTSDTLNKFF